MSAADVSSPVGHALRPGRYGAKGGEAVVITSPLRAMWQLMAAKGGTEAINEAVQALFGIALPSANRGARSGDVTLLALQPDHWLVTAPLADAAALRGKLEALPVETVAMADQTWGKTILRITGTHARDVLAKGCRLDLDPRVFAPDFVAATTIAHVPTLVHRVGGAATYDLYVPSTFAEEQVHWLTTSAREFGYELV